MHRVILYCRVIYLCVKNVELSMHHECGIVDASRISNCRRVKNIENFQKTLQKSKKLHVTILKEFSTFSTLDVSNNEFLTHRHVELIC